MASGSLFQACNSSETWGTDPQDLSGTAVTAFSLKADKSVLNNLDSVFFSIDLVGCKIFNASPLPYETDVDSIAVSISSDACSVAELYYTKGGKEKVDTVVNYLTTPDQKIDFTNGPVRLHLVSADGQHERDYEIRVNVATEVSDSLYWDKMQAGKLRGVAGMNRAKTVKSGDKAFMITTASDGAVGISVFLPNAKSGGGNWEASIITPSFIDVNTTQFGNYLNIDNFTATDNGDLYVTDSYGNLHLSTDGGQTFRIVDTNWENISAPYGNAILGVKENAGARTLGAYPSSAWSQAGQAIPTGFPVSGNSQAATFATKWAASPQIVIAGGKTATGSMTGNTWAFDGKKWAEISNKLPAATGYAMAKYTIAETDTVSWRVKQREVLIAFNGMGMKPVQEVWVSRDMGVNWQKGSDLLQLPEYIPFATQASLLVFDKTLDASTVTPLAVAPITSWECPYLYLFGGYDTAGKLQDSYWSGVVNHLKVKPLQ